MILNMLRGMQMKVMSTSMEWCGDVDKGVDAKTTAHDRGERSLGSTTTRIPATRQLLCPACPNPDAENDNNTTGKRTSRDDQREGPRTTTERRTTSHPPPVRSSADRPTGRDRIEAPSAIARRRDARAGAPPQGQGRGEASRTITQRRDARTGGDECPPRPPQEGNDLQSRG